MNHIVQVASLAEFVREVPTPLIIAGSPEPNQVRLIMTERGVRGGKLQVPYKNVELSLQGLNSRGEIVWLMWSFVLDFPDDDFMNRHGHALYKLMPAMKDLVEVWLTAHGYSVMGGRYALPKSIALLRGSFECVRIVKDGEAEFHLEEAG